MLSWFQLVILILASFRLTRLIVFDEITAFLRAPFFSVSYETTPSGQVIRNIDIHGKGWRYAAGLLLSCHWCVGVWSSIFLVSLYLLVPASLPFHLILAVAGAASFLETKIYP